MPRGKRMDAQLMEMLKRELNTSTLTSEGRKGGGCISEGTTYRTDTGRIFVKINHNKEAKDMFDGEAASLDRIHTTRLVKVPKPIKVLANPAGGAAFVMENLDIVSSLSSKAATLGEQLARLHQNNRQLARQDKAAESSLHKDKEPAAPVVKRFGFEVPTCCGSIPQNNSWLDSWEEFYGRKIQQQVDMLQQEYNDRQAAELWQTVLRKLPEFFSGLDIYPALLHGDLWAGNVAETADQPVMFDAASFYGHSEYDLAISHMFGGFSKHFFDTYFSVIPKAAHYKERLELYKLFHQLNHWNHFGEGYRGSSLAILRYLQRLELK